MRGPESDATRRRLLFCADALTITGPMQVHGRGELTFQERLAAEREYVENYSLDRDVRILLRKASAIFRPTAPTRARWSA